MAGREPIVESVPNFSEGRDARIVASLAESIRQLGDVRLLDYSADADHNRSVFTFTGTAEGVAEAALAAARVAVQSIDLTKHTGVHPRMGAADVIPFVPLAGTGAGTGMEQCVELARNFGETLWEQLRVPVFLYGHAAVRGEHRKLEDARRLERRNARPDIGEGRHPTAGACAVGARDFLIAWNIWLDTTDLNLAKQIACAVRFSSGGFSGVKALGLPLTSAGIVQVSINTTDFRATPLDVVFDRVCELAGRAKVAVRGSELIGMIPRAALDLSSGHDLRWLNLEASRVL